MGLQGCRLVQVVRYKPDQYLDRNIDKSCSKRVFLLGPAHHIHLRGCSLSKLNKNETPLGDLVLCLETIKQLRATKRFTDMSQQDDEDEHSLEMHLPYIYKMLQL